MSPTLNPIRDSLTSADGVAGDSMAYSIPRPGIPLWIRKGDVFEWVPKYGAVPGREWTAPVVSLLADVRGV